MNIELIGWLKQRPKWLQEAAKRVFTKDLDNQDIVDLTELCKQEAAGELKKTVIELDKHRPRANTPRILRLCSIGDIEGINALAPKKPLEFGADNLAVIYGQNGSGKSGYVRILKHACGARHPGILYPNVYSSETTEQKCNIVYEQNQKQMRLEWKVDSGIIDSLRYIDVFDSSCGGEYITKENEVTYEPPILFLLSKLTNICEDVSGILENEVTQLSSRLPKMPPEFASSFLGQWYNDNLSFKTKVEEIERHCNWTEEHSCNPLE